jgi:hypothetical protein
LDGGRRRLVRQRTAACLCAAAAAIALLLGGMAVADYFGELAWSLRAVWLLAAVGAAVAGLVWGVRQVRAYSLRQAAGDLERRTAKFGQRLRTTLDYHDEQARPAAAHPSLVRALDRDTAELATDDDFSQITERRWLPMAAAALVGVLLIGGIALLANGELRIAAGRAILLPWEYTTVAYSPEQSTVRHGESVTIEAAVSGRPVHEPVVRFRPASGEGPWQTLLLEPVPLGEDDAPPDGQSPSTERLTATIAECQEDLVLEVLVGPRPLPPGSIRVLQPLALELYEARIVPPEYTGRQPETSDRWDLRVLEGSNVDLVVRLNRPAAEASLEPIAAKRGTGAIAADQNAESASSATSALPLALDGRTVRGRLADLRTGGSWRLVARAADGIELEPQRLSIRVQPDARPQVRFVEPAEELEVIPTTEIAMTLEADDDLGLLRVGIACQVADGPMQTLWERDCAGTEEAVRDGAALLLEDYGVTFPDAVTYYAFAEDNYFGQPRRTSTPLRFVDIRPFQRAYQMLDSGGT